MLGYVFDGEIEKARNSVAASIAGNRRKLKSAVPGLLVPSQVATGLSGISETSHVLPQGLFRIYHLFIDVS